ncbi:MAG TPA: TonB-dependent receptor [Acidobacteriaceae bacterium]|nr:TonB-dependent receptor [Acidobacteriaceae bacterium]
MGKIMRFTVVLAISICASAALAQNTNSGDIRGTVTDKSGAVIPGVTVSVLDVDKGVTHTYTTDGAGLFDTGSIVPDHYILTFTKEGFTTYERGPITLYVGTTMVNGQLSVGATTQRVVVSTDVPLLQTETGAQEATLNSKTMAQLPQTGADWQNFIMLLPGAAGTPENDSMSMQPGAGQTSINGNLPYASVLADGATTTLPMSQNSDVTIFETTSEVKVSTSAFSAQYGVGNIIYNQITKGGGGKFHGAGYEYFQNNVLNASPYAFGTNTPVPVLHYNNFGVAVGGPILPHRLFFYFDYDKTIDNGGASISFNTVPTPAVKNGMFTAAGSPTLYDPTTQTFQMTGTHTYTGSQYPGGALQVTCPCVIRQSFDSEYHNGNVLPPGMINPVAKNIQAYFPAPNLAGQPSSGIALNNYTSNTPGKTPFTKFFGRLDFDVTSHNRLTVSETESDNPVTDVGIGICPINCESQDVSRDNAQVSDVWTISPEVINEARLGFTDQLNFFVPDTLDQGYAAKLGFAMAKADNFPDVQIGNGSYYELGNNGSTPNAVYKEFVFDPSDVVTMIRGRHVLHFGGEFLINRADSTAWGNIVAGTVAYSGSYTSAGGAATTAYDGTAYADFLLGQTQNWNAKVAPEYGARWKSPQLFVQDDYKMRPNLTVNLGLRWQGMTGWSEVKGNITAFDPTVVNPANNSLGAMWYAFSHANGRTTLQAPKYNTFLPRVGFSYQPSPNMVLRGGFGMYGSVWSEDTYGGGIGNAFGSSGTVNDSTNGFCPVVQLDTDGSTPDTRDPGCGVGNNNPSSINSKYLTSPTTPDAQNGANSSVTYNQYHTPVPLNYQWTLAVQREIGTNYVGEIAYIGNHGTNLNFPVDIDQVPEDKLGPNDLADKPYPLFGSITGSPNNAVSNYNALQAQITKRMATGLEFNANYTWSHFMNDLDSSGWGSREGYQNYQNAFDTNANYSRSNFDLREMFKAQAVYMLPIGEGRQFLNNNRLLDTVIGGWQTSGTVVLQTGAPIGITTGGNNSSNNQSGSYTQFANQVGNVSLPGSTKSRLNEWYNLNALVVPAPFTYGNFRRNVVSGPGLNVVNFSLGKNFHVWESVAFQIRADATNVFNHASFGQPGNNAIGNGQSAQITGTTVGGRTMQLYGRISF